MVDENKEPEEGLEPGTPTNPEEGGEPSPEAPTESQETPEEPDKAIQEIEEKNKQLFERAKKAEAKVKILESQKPKEGGDQIASVDPLNLAKTVSALKDYSPDELDYVQVIAKGKGISLDDAVKTEEVKTYVEAKRLKVDDDKKTPAPSAAGSGASSKEITRGMKQEEMDTILKKKAEAEVEKDRRSGV